MADECIDIIRAGLRAYENDRTRKACQWLNEMTGGYDYRRQREQEACDLITQQLKAARQVRSEARRAIASQAAAEARLNRLLGCQGQAAEASIAVRPSESLDEEAESTVRDMVNHLLYTYYSLGGGGNPAQFQYPPLERFRVLVSRADTLSDRFPRALCDRIVRQAMSQMNW